MTMDLTAIPGASCDGAQHPMRASARALHKLLMLRVMTEVLLVLVEVLLVMLSGLNVPPNTTTLVH